MVPTIRTHKAVNQQTADLIHSRNSSHIH